jgi:MucR family transcriptional regulator, transcriptional regulator of exopolysaccharide biosynthesis
MTATIGVPQQTASLKLASDIVAAYVSNNPVLAADLPALIKSVHSTLLALDSVHAGDHVTPKPAVPIKKSVTDNYIVCLEDGRKLKMLKRYLRSRYKMSPEDYRAKWGLPLDYPMVAPNYASLRSEFAKKIGLGRAHKPNRGRRRS